MASVTYKTYKKIMAIFENDQPEEFLFFFKESRRTPEDMGEIYPIGNIIYLH